MQHAHIKTKNSKTADGTMFIEEPCKRAVFENAVRVLILVSCIVHIKIVRCLTFRCLNSGIKPDLQQQWAT